MGYIPESLLAALRDKTAFIVSHRLSFAVMTDRVFLLKDGSILESGSHNELMEAKGEYYRLFTMQSAKYLDGEEDGNEEAVS
jgi:ABC-type multidrug transport system fused ATPase/permease subunit